MSFTTLHERVGIGNCIEVVDNLDRSVQRAGDPANAASQLRIACRGVGTERIATVAEAEAVSCIVVNQFVRVDVYGCGSGLVGFLLCFDRCQLLQHLFRRGSGAFFCRLQLCLFGKSIADLRL